MLNKKISFFNSQDIEQNPLELLKKIIPGIDTTNLEASFVPINSERGGIGSLYDKILFQGVYLDDETSGFEMVKPREIMYALKLNQKGKNDLRNTASIIKKGDNYVLADITGSYHKNKTTKKITKLYNDMREIALIPGATSNERMFYDLNNNLKVLQSTTDIIDGVSTPSNASYSEIGALVRRIVQGIGFNTDVYEKSLKTILNKNIANIEHNNEITIGNIFSHKELSGIEEGYDVSLNKYIVTNEQFNKLALLDSRDKGDLNNAIIKNLPSDYNVEKKIVKGATNVETFENTIEGYMGEKPKFYKFNIEEGKDVIKNITAVSESGKSFTFNNLSINENEKLINNLQYAKETTSNDSSILYHTIPNENKSEIRNLITDTQKKYQTLKNKEKLDFAKDESIRIANLMKQRYAESHGVNLETFVSSGGGKELEAIKATEIEAMIHSGRNFDYGQNIGKQSQNTIGGVKRLQGSFAHPLSYLNKEGQRKAQSIDQLSSVHMTNSDGTIFDVGESINKIGEDIDQLKYKKLSVQSAQLNALDELVKENTELPGVSYGLKSRRGYVLYSNSNFAFQDSNVVSTQVAMSGAGMSDRGGLRVDYASLNLDKQNGRFTTEEINDIVHGGGFNNKNILVDGTTENKIVRSLLGEDNYTKYASKNEYIEEIKNLKNIMPSGLDLNNPADRKQYVEAMDLITKRYNELNQKYLIKGNELAKATILSDEILNSGQLKTITKSNMAFVDDISFGKYGINIKTGNVTLGGEGAKLMNEMVKLTVQNTNHLMGIKSGNDFLPVEMFINEKTTAKKRGFTGSFLTSYLQTAYTNAHVYGNQDMNDFDKYLRANGEITYNGKTTNIMDLLNLDISIQDGKMMINDKSMTGIIKKSMFSKDSLPYEEYLENISRHIESRIGKINDKDSSIIGSLISSKLEEVYGNYINQFSKDKSNMQIGFEDIDIYSSNMHLTNDGVEKITSFKKAYRFINSFTKMNESVSRKDMEGLKFGRISNFVLDEQLQTDLVEMIEGKIMTNTEDKLTKIIGLTAMPGTPFERGSETYNKTFGTNSIDINKVDSSIKNINISIKDYIENSPIGKNILKLNQNNEVEGDIFGSVTGFNKELSKKYKNFFANKEIAKEELLKNYLNTVLGNNWDKTKFKTAMTNFNSNLFKEKNFNKSIRDSLENSLIALGKTKSQAGRIANDENFLNSYKILYGLNSVLNVKDISNLNSAEYEYLTKISNANPNILDNIIEQFTKNATTAYGMETDVLRQDILGTNIDIFRNLKNLSGENVFSLVDLKETFEKDALPFFLDELKVDGQGTIVYNKELANIENLINNNVRIKEIDVKKTNFKSLLDDSLKLYSDFNKKINLEENDYKKLILGVMNNLDVYEKEGFMKQLGLTIDTNKFKSQFRAGGNLNLGTLNNASSLGYVSDDTLSKITKVKTTKDIDSLIGNLDFTLERLSGKGEYSTTYTNIKNDLNIIKKVFNKSIEERINNLSYNDSKTIITSQSTPKGFKIDTFINNKLESLDKEFNRTSSNIFSSILNRTSNASESLFKNKGFVYNAPTMKFTNSFALSPREGTGIIDYIANEAEELFGKGHYNKKYDTWSLDNKSSQELTAKYNDFKKALKTLYGGHYSDDIMQDILSNKYNKASLTKDLNELSGIAIGTKEQFSKLNLLGFFGERNYTYQALSRNPHQYLSSIRGTRYVMLDDETKNLSFFKSYYGNQTKIDGMQNNLLFVGKRTAMASHGDFDGDVFQGLFLSAKDFGYKNKGDIFVQNKKLRNKMEYMNILADISRRDLESEIKSGKIKKDFSRLLTLARKGFDMDESSTNEEVFGKIKNTYFINKAEYIRTSLELDDESTKHSIIPNLRKAFANLDGENIEFDKAEVTKIVGKMSANEKLSLFLGNVDDEKLKNIDEYIKGSPSVKNYINKYLQVKNETDKSKAFLAIVKELNSSKDNINWVNASLTKSAYADYTGINRTGIVHSKLSAYRESATVILHEDLFNNKYKLNIAGIDNNLKNLVNETIGFGSISEYIEGIGISAKLGGNVNPYETLNTFEAIRRSFENRNVDNLISDKKVKDITDILKRNMETKLTDIKELQGILGEGNLTTKGVSKYITNNLGLDETSMKGFIKLIDLEGTGESLNKYNGLQLLRGMSNLVAIYSNAELNRKNGGVDVINKFRKMINADNGNLLARTQRLGSQEDIPYNLGQNFRVVRQAYKNVQQNLDKFIKKFYKKNEVAVEEAEEHTNKIVNNSINSIKKKTQEKLDYLRKNIIPVQAEEVDSIPIETATNTEAIKEINEEVNIIKAKYEAEINRLEEVISNSSDNASKESLDKIKTLQDEIENLKATINSKNNHISDLESSFTSIKSDYESNLKSTMQEMERLKKGIEEASQNKKARFVNTKNIDNLNELNIKNFISGHKKEIAIGSGIAILGTFLRIFQSSRSVVKLNINEEEYQDEKTPLQRQFGGYEINTNIRSFYR